MNSDPNQSLDPGRNRLYARAADLSAHHWERLAARDPLEAAAGAGCEWLKGEFRLLLLGSPLLIDPLARSVRFEREEGREPGYQRALVAVAYLSSAMDAPPSGRMVPPRELPGGDSFFRGPHAVAQGPVAAAFGADPERVVSAALGMGGTPVAGGDAAFALPALPRIGLEVVLWRGDEEFGPRALLLADSRAHLHLPLDCVWALTNLACSGLSSR